MATVDRLVDRCRATTAIHHLISRPGPPTSRARPSGEREPCVDRPDRDPGQLGQETGIDIEITGLVGVFSDPGHVIAYLRGDEVTEVRQPVNVCLHARPIGGTLTPAPDEARQVGWVLPEDLEQLSVHPAIRARIAHALLSPDVPLVQ